METPLPTVDEGAPVSIIAALLQRYPAVLVVRGGEIAGIVAKSDLMKLL
jgi:predicted transcriptional regulator